jgi:membrane protease YdiL (CAAX protease family)
VSDGSAEARRQRRWLLGIGILVEGGLALLALLLGWLFDDPAAATLSWNLQGLWLGLAAAVPMLIGFFACVRWPLGPLARIKQFSDEVIRPLFGPCSLGELTAIAVAAGFGEELLFRGFLQELISGWLDPATGLIAASVVFGLLHAITPTYAVLAALLGAYLGGCWLATGNLLVPIVAHAVYDLVALIYLARRAAPVTA